MALFKIAKGLSSNLATTKIEEGKSLLTTDTHQMYVDISNTERIALDSEKANFLKGDNSNAILPEKPEVPIKDGEMIPWTWKQINEISLTGKQADYFELGAIKTCLFSPAFLNAKSVYTRVIGINLDGDNTTTFHSFRFATAPPLETTVNWENSVRRQYCQTFYESCDCKKYIKPVIKGTCLTDIVPQYNGEATYLKETAWLLSEGEAGCDGKSTLIKSNWIKSNAECTQGEIFSYPYYDSDEKRQLTLSGTTQPSLWWTRSNCTHQSEYFYCVVINAKGQSEGASFNYSRSLAPAFVIGLAQPEEDGIIPDLGSSDIYSRLLPLEEGKLGQTIKVTSDGVSWVDEEVKPVSLSIVSMPEKIEYTGSEILDTTGLILQLSYNDGTYEEITEGYSCSISKMVAIGKQYVTITYKNMVTGFYINVVKAQYPLPKYTGPTIEYDGTEHNILGSDNWNWSWDNDFATFLGGDTSAINAGTYYVVFELKNPELAEWADGTTEIQQASWTIEKAECQLRFVTQDGVYQTFSYLFSNLETGSFWSDSPNIQCRTSTNLSSPGELLITLEGDSFCGTYEFMDLRAWDDYDLDWSPEIFFSYDPKQNTADGTPVTRFTLQVTETDNFKASNIAYLVITQDIWYWPTSDIQIGESFFQELQLYLKNNSIGSMPGAYTTTLNTTLKDGTACRLKVIDGCNHNQSKASSVTFMADYGKTSQFCDETLYYGDTYTFTDTKAYSECLNFYNNFPGKEYFSTENIGTCRDLSVTGEGTAHYDTLQVWLLSENEVNLDSLSCLQSFYVSTYNAENVYSFTTPYECFTDNDSRMKGKRWWLRSLSSSVDVISTLDGDLPPEDRLKIVCVDTTGKGTTKQPIDTAAILPCFTICAKE